MTKVSKSFKKIALGTVQFGLPYGIANLQGQVTRSEAGKILQLAHKSGIAMLDTAIGYGESEKCLGELGVQDFKIITKLPIVPEGCVNVKNWVKEQLLASCSRLNVKSIYGLLLHCSSQAAGLDGKILMRVLHDLKNDGLVQKLGVSIYDPSELDTIVVESFPDIVQAPLNLVDHRLDSTGWLTRLNNEGTEIHVRSVFLQGLLLMPRISIPQKFKQWATIWGKWHNWLLEHQISAIEACLAYPLSFPEIDRVVVGVDSVNQLSELMKAARSTNGNFPDLCSFDENLINPSYWGLLE